MVKVRPGDSLVKSCDFLVYIRSDLVTLFFLILIAR
jgi:hypothetical protein